MNLPYVFSIILTSFSILPLYSQSLPLIPVPQNYSIDSSSFLSIPDRVSCHIEGDAMRFRELFEDINTTYDGVPAFYHSKDKGAFIRLTIDPQFAIGGDLSEQAYEVKVRKEGIDIKARTEQGLLYGIMTVLQLLDKAPKQQLPLIAIQDWPDMAWRGVSDDIARGQVSTLENFKRIIRFMARYKMNVYMPYVEDALSIAAFPDIGKDRGALTKEEAEALVAYATIYHIDIIPVIQTLGHFENILSMDAYKHLAEFPGAASLSVANDSTYLFLETIMEEVFDIFPTQYFHMGADESYDVGQGASAEMTAESSLAQIHLQHYLKVYNIAKKHDKTVLMYSDILLDHQEILPELPKDIVLVDWHYRAENAYPSIPLLKNMGFETLVSPSVWNFLTPFPTYLNALPNIEYITKAGVEADVMGMINSNWGDYGAETFKELVLYGYAWSAQCSWHMASSQPDTFAQAFFHDFFGVSDPAFASIYQDLSNPLNQMLWNEFWRHPALDERTKAWWEPNIATTGKIAWQQWTLPNTRKKIAAVTPQVTRNKEHLEMLDFMLDLTTWYQQKLEWQLAIRQPEQNIDMEAIHVAATSLKQQLKTLAMDYRTFWLKYYKEDNLWMIEDKFERMQQYIDETNQQLQANDSITTPEISSDWIYHPDSLKSATFSHTFTIASDLSEAKLQLLADTEATLYINDQKVVKIDGRRSLSLLDDYRRIAYLPISEYLGNSKNTIRIVVRNYNRKGAAGVNVIARLQYADGSTQLLESNDNWEVSGTESSQTEKAQSRKYAQTTIAPNFDNDRSSWFER